MQAFIDAWIKRRGDYWSPLSQYARLAEEVGELGRELNFQFGDKPRAAKDPAESAHDHNPDVHLNCLLLGNYPGIGLDSALNGTLKQYKGRTQRWTDALINHR